MRGSNIRFDFRIETRKTERGFAEKPAFIVITCFMYENRVLAIYLDGSRSGNESYIDLLLGSSATPPPIFALIGNNDFVANLC